MARIDRFSPALFDVPLFVWIGSSFATTFFAKQEATMQTAKKNRSSVLPLLGFLGASGIFLWWAAKSPNQQAIKTLPPSDAKWRSRFMATTVRPVFVAGREVLPMGAAVYAVQMGDEFVIAPVRDPAQLGVSPDDLEWLTVRAADFRKV